MRRGFTLIELTVVLVIIGLIIGGGLATMTAGSQQATYNSTIVTMKAIDSALYSYAVALRRLPCPADLTQLPSALNYGVEAANKGSCVGGAPAANYKVSGVAEGGVPTRTLRLPDTYMYDGWGHRLRYAVDTSYTNATASNANLPASSGGVCGAGTTTYPITVTGVSSSGRTSTAVYVLLSHGSNSHGAYTYGGTVFNAGNSNGDVWTNCHCNISGTSTGYSPTYVQEVPNYSAGHLGNAAYFFDDIVSFRENWQLTNTAASTGISINSIPSELYVSDTSAADVQKYTFGNTTWAPLINTANSGITVTSPWGVYVDRCGNFWLTDYGSSAPINSKIYKYTTSTSSWTTFLTSTTYNAYYAPIGIDSKGNIWIADRNLRELIEYSSNGTLIYAYAHAAADLSGSTSPSYNDIRDLYIDSSDNIWLTDTSNNQIDELVGSGNGYGTWYIYKPITNPLSSPYSAFVDSSSNLWVADNVNHVVQKCAISGLGTCSAWTIYGTYGTSGSSAGKFTTPSGIRGDSSGNIWVADHAGGVSRIQEYSNSTWSIVLTTGYGGSAFSSTRGIWVGGR